MKMNEKTLNILGIEAFGTNKLIEDEYFFNKIPLDELDEKYKKKVREFVRDCQANRVKFEYANVYIKDIDNIDLYYRSSIMSGHINWRLTLWNSCYICNGVFDNNIYLHNHSSLNRFTGIFNETVKLFEQSYILGGNLRGEVKLQDNSCIRWGVFNDNVFLKDNSVIYNGYFEGNIYLGDKAKILDARFGDNCKVFLDKEWYEDKYTILLLNRNEVPYSYITYTEEEFDE
jgi:hypothetical protein